MKPVIRKELSGFFLAPHKFTAALQALADPCCDVTHVRLFHNNGQHLEQLLAALQQGNTSVTHLDIYELDTQGATALAAFFTAVSTAVSSEHHLPRISSLIVQRVVGNDAAALLAAGLGAVSAAGRGIQELHLAGITDDTQLSAVLSAAAAGDCALRMLRLDHCTLGPRSAAAAAVAVASLCVLDLQGSTVQDAEVASLLSSLQQQERQQQAAALAAVADLPRLTDLNLTGARVGEAGAAAMAQALASCSQLTRLALGDAATLGDAGASALAQGVAVAPQLRQLDLQGCGIGAEGAVALAGSLRTCRTLVKLNLDGNTVGSRGLAALLAATSAPHAAGGEAEQQGVGAAAQQQHQPSLQLHLEGNGIQGAELLECIAPVAKQQAPPNRLGALHLGRNGLSDAGVAALMSTIGRSAPGPAATTADSRAAGGSSSADQQQATEAQAGIEVLDLRDNAIGDEGARTISAVINSGALPHLHTLVLDGNRVRNAGAAELLSAAAQAPSLHTFRGEGWRMTDPALRMQMAELTLVLAARKAAQQLQQQQQQQQRGAGEPGPHSCPGNERLVKSMAVKRGGGGRFPPEVYAPPADMDADVSQLQQQQQAALQQSQAAAGGGPAAEELPAGASRLARNLAAKKAGRGRFGPEAYAAFVPRDAMEVDGDQQQGQAAGGGSSGSACQPSRPDGACGGSGSSNMPCGGTATPSGVLSLPLSPRGFSRRSSASGAAGGGGADNAMDWCNSGSNAGANNRHAVQAWGGGGGGGMRTAGCSAYAYDSDCSMGSGRSSASQSPTRAPGAYMQAAGAGQQQQVMQQYANGYKRRTFRALTPEQQRMFDCF